MEKPAHGIEPGIANHDGSDIIVDQYSTSPAPAFGGNDWCDADGDRPGTTRLPAQQGAQSQISDTSLAQDASPHAESFLLTVFLKHDESKPLDQINAQLKAQGFYRAFPPEGTQVVSWYVMMGIGQVVTLRVPAERLREVNRAIEQTAWGGYRTEFYATYDYKNIGEDAHAKALVQ